VHELEKQKQEVEVARENELSARNTEEGNLRAMVREREERVKALEDQVEGLEEAAKGANVFVQCGRAFFFYCLFFLVHRYPNKHVTNLPVADL